MAAKGTFELTTPGKVNMTLTITMSLDEWKEIKSRLRPTSGDGAWYLDDTISQMLDQANKQFHFYEELKK